MKIEIEKAIVNINPKGISRSLKYKHPDILTILEKHKETHKTSNICESIFWILNDLISPPLCSNCLKKIKFKGLTIGYPDPCVQCTSVKRQKQTTLDRYGVDNINKLESTKQKIKETCLKRYGVESHNKLKSVKDKKKKTLIKNYGEEGLKHSDILEKRRKTSLDRYGEEHHLKTKRGMEKQKATLFKNYGVDSPMRIKGMSERFKKVWVEKNLESYVKRLIKVRGYKLISSYVNSHSNITLECEKGHHFEILWNSFQQGNGTCPECYPLKKGISKPEKDIKEYIESLGFECSHKNRSIITPYEIDVLVDEKKLAIEYCGLWCHSSGGNVPFTASPDQHLKKLNRCESKGYHLLTIFEDEWLNSKDVVLSIIKLKLGNVTTKIPARKCEIREISYKVKHEFIESNHLQGDKASTHNIGLYYNEALVSVMSFLCLNKQHKKFEIARYCTTPDTIIQGGGSRLLSYFKKNFDWTDLITYADRRWSTGNCYHKMGFVLDYTTNPNYWYWGKSIKGRKHRLNYSKRCLAQMESYDDELSEFQIMTLEGYSWIHDCGNIKFSIKNI